MTIINDQKVAARDGASIVKIISVASYQVVDTISIGGMSRRDEMGWDSADHR